MAICEVKPKNGGNRTLQDYSITGYETYHTNIEERIGRGIIILAHSTITHLILQISSPILVEEVCLVEI